MKFSKRLRSRLGRFKLSKRSIRALGRAGIKSIWYHHTGYAYVKFDGKSQPMHRILMAALGYVIDGMEVDHKNGETLDCRISNMRVVTKKQNSFNVMRPKNNTSGFKGVHWIKKNRRWCAYIGKCPRVNIGCYGTKEEAARAYNREAKKRYGKFAKLNILPKRTD